MHPILHVVLRHYFQHIQQSIASPRPFFDKFPRICEPFLGLLIFPNSRNWTEQETLLCLVISLLLERDILEPECTFCSNAIDCHAIDLFSWFLDWERTGKLSFWLLVVFVIHLVACCLLLVACCMLLAACCLLLVVHFRRSTRSIVFDCFSLFSLFSHSLIVLSRWSTKTYRSKFFTSLQITKKLTEMPASLGMMPGRILIDGCFGLAMAIFLFNYTSISKMKNIISLKSTRLSSQEGISFSLFPTRLCSPLMVQRKSEDGTFVFQNGDAESDSYFSLRNRKFAGWHHSHPRRTRFERQNVVQDHLGLQWNCP